MDAPRVGSVVRAVRLRKGWRQADVAAAARVSISTVSRVERGSFGPISVGMLLRVAAALEIRIDWLPRWRGGELDRMLNSGHAAMHEAAALELAGTDWVTAAETTFAIYGERGAMDILAFHRPTGALLVVELKTDLVDVQALTAPWTDIGGLPRRSPAIADGRRPRSAAGWCCGIRPRTIGGSRRMPRCCGTPSRSTGAGCEVGCAARSAASRRCLSYRILMPGELAALPRASNGSAADNRAWLPPGIVVNSLPVRI